MALTIADRTTKSTTYRDPQLGDRWRQFIGRLDDVWLKDQSSGWQWEAVDEAPVVDGLNGYAWRVDRMRHRFRMAEDGGRAWYPRRDLLEFVTFGKIQARVGTNWQDVNLGPLARTGNVFTWDRWASQGFRLKVVITWRSVKFEVEYKDAASARRVRWPVSLTGLVWDGWQLRSVSDGQIVGGVQAPWAEDSSSYPKRFPVTASTYLEDGQRYVEFTASLAGAVYPVKIDPTLEVTSGTGDRHIFGASGVWATARSTSDSLGTDGNVLNVGAAYDGTYYPNRGFLRFDTSSLGTDDISQVNLKLTPINDQSATDFDLQIVKQDWSAQDPLADANREAAYDNCLSGTADDSIWRNTSGIVVNTTYTSGNLSTAWINKTGNTYYSLRSSRDFNDNTPTGNEYVGVGSADHATAAYRPTLVVEHTAAGGSASLLALLGVG